MFTYSINGKKNFIGKSNDLNQLKETIIEEEDISMNEDDILLFYDEKNNLIDTPENFDNYTKNKNNVVIIKIQKKNEEIKNDIEKTEIKNNNDNKMESEINDKIDSQKKKNDFNESDEENKNEDIIKNSYSNEKKEIESNSNIPLINVDLLVETFSKIIDDKLNPLYEQLDEEKKKNEEAFKTLESKLNNSNEIFNKSLENIDSKLKGIITNNSNSQKFEKNLGPDLQNINQIINEINNSYQQEINGVSILIQQTTQSINNYVQNKFKELKEKSPSNFHKIEESINRCNNSLIQQFNKFKKDINTIMEKDNEETIIMEDNNEYSSSQTQNFSQKQNSQYQYQNPNNQYQNPNNQYQNSNNQYRNSGNIPFDNNQNNSSNSNNDEDNKDDDNNDDLKNKIDEIKNYIGNEIDDDTIIKSLKKYNGDIEQTVNHLLDFNHN